MGRRVEGWVAEKWRQQKQALTQKCSQPRTRSALPHVQVTECPFLAPPAPRSCMVVEIHPDFWLCKAWLYFLYGLLLPWTKTHYTSLHLYHTSWDMAGLPGCHIPSIPESTT